MEIAVCPCGICELCEFASVFWMFGWDDPVAGMAHMETNITANMLANKQLFVNWMTGQGSTKGELKGEISCNAA